MFKLVAKLVCIVGGLFFFYVASVLLKGNDQIMAAAAGVLGVIAIAFGIAG